MPTPQHWVCPTPLWSCHSLCTRCFPCDTVPSSPPMPVAHPTSEREPGRAAVSGLVFGELRALLYLRG